MKSVEVRKPGLLIAGPDGITDPWLSAVLSRDKLSVVHTRPIGTGQMSQAHRVTYRDGTGNSGTVVVKLASDDPVSRAAGVGVGAYLREVTFYQRLNQQIDGPTPECYLAEYDSEQGWFTLVLQDATESQQGDQISGCDPVAADNAIRALARLQAPVFDDATLGASEWLNLPNPLNQALLSALLSGFFERYGDLIAPEHAEVCRRYVEVADAHTADIRGPRGLVHADYRLDNMLFDPNGECMVVDWQGVQWGPVMLDAAYFIGGSLTVEDRRAHEQRLLHSYLDTLLENGVTGFGWDQCWAEYRRQVFWGVAMTIGASMVVQRTQRGDAMFMAMLARACQQALDLDSVDLLPRLAGSEAEAPAPPNPTN